MNLIYSDEFLDFKKKDGFAYIDYRTPQIAILCHTSSELILVKQYRRLIGEETIELPAGSALVYESLTDAAHRELGEETGIWIEDKSRLVKKYEVLLCPNRFLEPVNVFFIKISEEEIRRSELSRGGEISEVMITNYVECKKLLDEGVIKALLPREILLNFLLNETD